MMHRQPSLRTLRRKRPDNVAILPSAATTQISQPQSKASRATRQTMRESQSTTFPYKHPNRRSAEAHATAIRQVSIDPGVILAHAILAELDLESRHKVATRLARTSDHSQAHEQAFAVANSTVLSCGKQADLITALAALRGPA